MAAPDRSRATANTTLRAADPPITVPPVLVPPLALVLGAAVALATRSGAAPTLVVLTAAAGSVVVLTRPWSVVVVACIAGPLCSGLRRGMPFPLLRAGEAFLLIGAGIALARHRPTVTDRRRLAFGLALMTYVTGTVVLGVLSTRRSGGTLGTEQLGLLVVPVFHALAYVCGRTVAADARRARRVLRGVLIGSGGLAALAIAQALDLPLVPELLGVVGDQSGFTGNVEAGYVARVTGLFNHWHLLAGYLVVALAVAASLALRPDPAVMRRRSLAIVIALDVVALTLTLTYTAFAGALGAVAVVGVLHGRGRMVLRRIAAVVAIAALVFSGALAHRARDQFAGGGRISSSTLLPQTVQFRLAVWEEQFLPAIEQRPALGWGTTAPELVRWPFTESVYVTLLLRGGVALLVMYAAMWIAMVLRALDVTRRSRRRPIDGVQGVVAPAVVGIALVLVPMQALFPYFTSPGVPHLLLLLCGLAFAPPGAQAKSVHA